MPDLPILLDCNGPVATITLNRPHRLNALSLDLIESLDRALDRIEASPEIRAVIVTGAGRAFSAGGDIDEMQGHDALGYYQRFAEPVHSVFNRIEALDRPTIAAVNGPALGGGTELLLTLDLRLLSAQASLGLPEINMGLFPGAGGTQRLIRQIPACRAKELLFTGETFSAQEAVAIGLANRIVPQDRLLPEANALALRLAAKSPLALRLLKRTVAEGADMPSAAALRHEQAMIALTMQSRAARDGLAAFREKRSATQADD